MMVICTRKNYIASKGRQACKAQALVLMMFQLWIGFSAWCSGAKNYTSTFQAFRAPSVG